MSEIRMIFYEILTNKIYTRFSIVLHTDLLTSFNTFVTEWFTFISVSLALMYKNFLNIFKTSIFHVDFTFKVISSTRVLNFFVFSHIV